MELVILGAGGTSVYMAEVALRSARFERVSFLDDDPKKHGMNIANFEVLGKLSAWRRLPAEVRFLNSLYRDKRGEELYRYVESLEIPDQRFAVVVDPTAVVSPQAKLAPGAFVGPLCTVEPFAALGERSALLGGVHVSHGCVLGRSVCCANSVGLAGDVRVHRGAYVGLGARIRGGVTVGEHAVVGMGAVVLNDVASRSVAVGMPASPR